MTARVLVLLGLALLLPAPAVAQSRAAEAAAARAAAARGDHRTAFEAFRALYDPAADKIGVLAGMASAAGALADLPRFRAVLDSVTRSGAAGPNAVSYWGALALQDGLAPDSVRAVFDRHLEDHHLEGGGHDRAALTSFVRVLEAHAAHEAAERVLEAAVRRGIPSVEVAILRGEVREARGDPGGALDLYLEALVRGEEGQAILGATRIGTLLDRWPDAPPLVTATTLLDGARRGAVGPAAARLAPLIVRARSALEDWDGAIEAAQDSALGPEAIGASLRSVAAAARASGEPAAAERAIETLLALGPPTAEPEDRLLLAEAARARGDYGEAAAELRRAAEAGITGAAGRALAAEVMAARESGDSVRLSETVGAAISGGVEPALVAVPAGDLQLAAGSPDSALAAYMRGLEVDPGGSAGLEALARVRLVQSLLRARVPESAYGTIGRTLVGASARPAAAAARLDSLASAFGGADTLGVVGALLAGLAGEWRGRAGDAAGASALLEEAALARGGGEAPALLLAAGRWASQAGDQPRAAALWRRVVERHGTSPYALEARRLLAASDRDVAGS